MRYADRIKGVYLLGSGWPVGRVAQALMIDRESVRNHHKRYRKGGRQRAFIEEYRQLQEAKQPEDRIYTVFS